MKKNYPKNAVFYLTKTFNIFLFICLMLVASASFGQTTIPFNSSGTFTVPCDVTSISVKVWGGGGSGGGSTSRDRGGEGGGAGGYSIGTISVSAGQRIDYIVGDGGRGRNGNGRDGSSSSFFTVTADGGKGGVSNSGSGAIGGSGNAGAGGNGGAGGGNTGGRGGSAPSGGTGGAGGNNNNGSDGNAPGGGGGGGETSNNGNDKSGGDGGNGKIEITYSSSFNSYCIPGFNYGVEPITNVTFAGINNTTTNTLGGPSLEVFCSPTASVVQGSSANTISVQGNTDGDFSEIIKVYIDWDNNGVYGNNPNEKYNLGIITNSTGNDGKKVTGNIAVPINAILGVTSMRVIKYYRSESDDPCFSGNDWGQAEDYSVNVTSPCPTYVINGVSATNTCISGTSTATISSTASGLPVGTYTVTYNRSSPSATGLTASMTVSTAGTGSFSVTGLTTAGSSTITVTKLTLGSCETTFTGKTASFIINDLVTNNSLSYSNGTSGQVSASPSENGSAVLNVPAGSYFSTVNFASYGTPTGTSPNFVINTSCHATTSQSVTEGYLLGNSSASIPATNAVFGDPCVGTVKRLYVLASYVEPLCSGSSVSITGSTPTGGNGSFTYLWQSSTTGATTGFTGAAGTNTGINYTSGAITQTTYFRRIVTSCSSTSTSSVVMVKVNPIMTVSTASSSPNVCVGTAITAVTHTTTGATGIGGATGLPAGVTSNFASNTITISGAPTASGIYNYSIPLTGGCGSVNATGTIIVSATDTAPIIGTRTQPTCTTATGSVILNDLPPEWELTQTDYLGDTKKTTGTGISTTISGLSPGTYTYSVVDTRKGLKGEYFNSTVTGASPPFPTTPPTLTRIDPTVGFDWMEGSPDPLINNNNFLVRWSGQVQPFHSENYTFTTKSDDGVRLWVNGVKLFEDWNDHGAEFRSGSITLTAGVKYNIVLEYYENAGSAVAELRWSSLTQTSQIIPQSQLFPSAICGSPASANVVIDAQPATPLAPSVTTTAATCSAAGSMNVTNYASGNTYVFTPSDITVSGTGVITGGTVGTSYTVRATNGSGCISPVSNSFTVINTTQLPTPAAPTIGTITQPDCKSNTGSIVLSNLPAGSWTVNPGSHSGSTTTANITGLNPGTYNFTVTNDSGCVSGATTDVVIEPAKTNTWNGTAWSDGTPTIDDKIIFSGDYPLAGSTADDIVACSCKVSGATSVVITKGRTLKVKYDVDVQSTGFLTFENNASLVQIDDNAINSGNIIYKRTTPEILKTDYVYWSSPVSLAALKAIQTGTLYYSFNGSGNSWVNANANTIMNTGKGYIVRGAGTWFDKGNVTLTANFVGVPNNGVIDVTIVGAGKNNLIGNPYPSAIDGDAFLAANTDVPGGPTDVLEGALYFWTHKSAIQLASGITNGTAGSGAYAYTSDDYSPFTKVGGTNSVTGNIAAGQSFFARGSSTTGKQAKFFNSMRLDGDNILDNSGFLKPASASKTEKIAATNKIEKSRIWLNLTNTQGAFKQMLLGYMTGATDNYDRGYDALSFNGNSFINFYSINNTSLLTIQGRALPIQQTDVVPLGYSSTIVGDFSISIDKTDGALSTMAVFLEDKLTNTTHNLKKGAYTFTTEKGTFNDRFVLSYVDKTTLATDDFQVVENQVVITSKNKEININTSTNYIDKVFVYDVTGKQIFLKSKIDKNEFTISNLGSTNHVLVVKVLLQDNSIVTKKIIF